MSTPIKVSVLMPAYNAEKFVGEAIESILNQTFDKFELIIIDDSSTDKTWEVLNEYKQKDDRISIYKNEVNLGISKTRNKLIGLAKAKYIVWQDADDISLPNRLNLQYKFMEQNPQVGISGGTLEFFSEGKGTSLRMYKKLDYDLRSLVFKQSPVSQGAAIIRKSILDKAGGFDEKIPQAEDLDLSLRIGRFSEFANLNEILIRYRIHENSISASKLRQNIKCTLMVRSKATNEYGYKMYFLDKVIYYITALAVVLPPKLTYFIFNTVRNVKL